MIKDSGERTEFSTGAVRDMKKGKGRMDLLPWYGIMEVSKHCEEGAIKYGEHNVDKGIPLHSLLDSASRHLAKFMCGETDEDHLRAAGWNILWALNQRVTHPELNDLYFEKKEEDTENQVESPVKMANAEFKRPDIVALTFVAKGKDEIDKSELSNYCGKDVYVIEFSSNKKAVNYTRYAGKYTVKKETTKFQNECGMLIDSRLTLYGTSDSIYPKIEKERYESSCIRIFKDIYV